MTWLHSRKKFRDISITSGNSQRRIDITRPLMMSLRFLYNTDSVSPSAFLSSFFHSGNTCALFIVCNYYHLDRNCNADQVRSKMVEHQETECSENARILANSIPTQESQLSGKPALHMSREVVGSDNRTKSKGTIPYERVWSRLGRS